MFGSVGAGNKSGWMTEDEIFKLMEHFISHVRSKKERPVHLLLDNHDSLIKTIKFAKENGVVMLQLKKYLSAAQDNWMSSNPDKSMTIYNITSMVVKALPMALNPTTIMNGFKISGIFSHLIEMYSTNLISCRLALRTTNRFKIFSKINIHFD